MRHLDSSQLVLLAFEDLSEHPSAAEHLASCDACRHEVLQLQRLSTVVGQTRQLRDLPAPPPRVWEAIVAQTTVDTSTAVPAAAVPAKPGSGHGPRGPLRPADGRPPRAVTARPYARQRLTRISVTTMIVLAALAGGAVAGVRWSRTPPPPAPAVLAAAELTAYGDTPATASGQAHVVDGHRLRLHVAGLPPVDGYYEVWLIDPGTMSMFSIGTLGAGSDGDFNLPANADLGTYRLVDVSAEHFDNNTAHSGDSLLRGLLG
ncbi:hypothetical protein CS0771_53230 [Catellatospora sp. IY07-71]|uniref:anti-sigma factor n=1 Tax=Catellatospora sp. IY07-71 TaxID=2728827 RepID=UPI001BB42299|nr:anti-sigma factor [Catellatospora sp. IY07-71]BCJ75779.1 hypothetical protein CS0771_53230 [Catellatospora sp. IY07-71]